MLNFDQSQIVIDFEKHYLRESHRVVIAYDTPSDRRRRRFVKALNSYATRVQKSVFEAALTDVEARILTKSLRCRAHPTEDDIRIYHQCARCASMQQLLGCASRLEPPMLIVA